MKLLRKLFSSHKTSAHVAKERLQIIVSHERAHRNGPEFLSRLQQELVEVIAKYVEVNPDQVNVNLGKSDHCSVLKLNITLPELTKA